MSSAAASTTATPAALWKPRANPWLIALAVMLGTFMEVLDTSIANVALPHLAGSLAITTDDATWVLTSYLIANAVVLTAAGWLGRRFGRRRFLLTCILIFVVASLGCGMAPNFPFLLGSLVVQGIGGGALQPSAQAILLESFPPQKRGQAIAVYTLGVVCAPVLGPTLGGWITDTYSWRWIFFVNVPVGLLAFLLVSAFVEDPPYIRNAIKTKIDAVGFALLATWIFSLQVVLDRGQESDWFGAIWIRWLSGVALVGFLAFVAWELTAAEPLVDLRALKNRNLAAGSAVIFVLGIVLYATIALLPLFLQTLMGYPALQSGLTVSPRGVGSVLGVIIVGRLVNVLDNRVMMIIAMAVLAYSSFILGNIDLQIGPSDVTWAIIINGFGISMMFIPLTAMTFATLRNEQLGNATSIFNLMRNVGGAVGISITTTLLIRVSQARQDLLSEHFSPTDEAFRNQQMKLQNYMAVHANLGAAHGKALQLIYNSLTDQTQLWAFVDDFRLLCVLCLACIPLVLLLKKPKHVK